MRLPKIAIQNYQFVLILVALTLMTGIISYNTMERSEDPVTEFPIYVVTAIYPGTSPEDMEELVVDPLEEAINEVDDIVEIRTTIKEGIAIIRIESTYDVDFDDKYEDILQEISSVRDDLPDELAFFEFRQVSPLEVNILQVALHTDNADYGELLDLAENLEDDLNKVSGVRKVEIEAYPEEEIRVALDFQRMANLNIPLSQVIGILQGNNANIPGGDLNGGDKSLNIKTSGGYKSIDEVANTVVNASPEGDVVYLKDIADVQFDYEDEQFIARYQKQKTIYVSVNQKENRNILEINEALQEKLTNFQETLPDGIEMKTVFVQAPAVAQRIDDFFSNLIQGVLLVGVVILLFMGFRSSAIVMTVIPTSIIIAIGALDMSGFGLQQISIAGLVIALGLLVDNGIVVIENINRFRKLGYPLKEAAVAGTSEVGWAIVSSTVTTLLAFFPLTQMQSGAGEFLKSLPVIVIYSLIASLILALSFTPLLASIFLKKDKKEGEITKVPKPTLIERFVKLLIEKIYRPTLRIALRVPLLVVVASVLVFVGSLALFPLVGVSLFPTADKPLLLIDINTPEGTNLAKTTEAALFVEQVLDTADLVKDYTTNIGHGNPKVYYNRQPQNYKKSHAQMMVNLKQWEYESFYRFIDELRAAFKKYPGAKITVDEFKNGPPYEAPVAIRVIGENFDTLKVLSEKVEKILQETEGTVNIDNPASIEKIDLKVDINKDKAGLIGLPIRDVDLAIRAGLTGIKVTDITTGSGDKYPLIVRLPFEEQIKLGDFGRIYIPTVNGVQVPLSQVANVELEGVATQVLHFNLDRNTTITAGVEDGYNVNEVTLEIISKLDEIDLPKGYEFYIAGEFEAQQSSFGNLGQILIVALVGIFAVLVLQFKSFVQPLIVFAAIPLAFMGSIFALFITGWTFSFFAFVGFTSLVGIVINNSIILVDYTNQLVAKGMTIKEAIIEACETRFTPILLTTLTTILGLLPLTLTASGLWTPLGWTIIGGMISSTFLTLLIVPILYKWFTRVKKPEKVLVNA